MHVTLAGKSKDMKKKHYLLYNNVWFAFEIVLLFEFTIKYHNLIDNYEFK